MGAIIQFLDDLGLVKTKEKMAKLIKTVKVNELFNVNICSYSVLSSYVTLVYYNVDISHGA